MLSQGFRFFSRSYHVDALNRNMDIMNRFIHQPEFIEAKTRFHIDFYNMKGVDSAVLEETLTVLFSPDNAQKTIRALNGGDLVLKNLLMANSIKRQLFLQKFSQESSIQKWDDFRVLETEPNLETLIAPFYRK